MNLDLKIIKELEQERLLRVVAHPSRPFFIANYTEKVQFDKLWDKHEYLKMCRGIIYDPDGFVVSRPFPKFFNLGEHVGPLPDGAFEVTEKMDGSLGILYGLGDWEIATRGSFRSDQAIMGNAILYGKYREYYDWFEEDKTYLFEIIYRENRIVVDYGDMADLVLIAVIDNETGRDDNSVKYELGPFPTVKKYTHIRDISDLVVEATKAEGTNMEGYVVRWLDTDYRLKVKLDEYLRLHRIMTGVTPKRIWEALKNGDNLDKWLENVPDEFSDEIRATADSMREAYARKADAAARIFNRIMSGFEGFAYPDRKQFAMEAKKHPCADILFLMYDGRDYSSRIWKLVEPLSDA